ncbi:MAG TPA: hypothetical protein VNU70_09165 [Puia sp.]|jgi:hypothetical protein|nr:hypothetical protein [Puia sp.]
MTQPTGLLRMPLCWELTIYREKGLGHEVAVLPMYKNIPDILDFLDKFVLRHAQLQIDLLYNDMEAKPMLTGSAKDLFRKLQGVK